MTKKYRLTPLGQLAVTLKFDKHYLAPATKYYKDELAKGRRPTFDELVTVTKSRFPNLLSA